MAGERAIVNGSAGPGGPHCFCCGRAVNFRKVARNVRKRLDRLAVEEGLEELTEEEGKAAQ